MSPIVGVTVYNPVSCFCTNSMSVLDSPSAPLLASATGRRASTANATQRIVVLLLKMFLIIDRGISYFLSIENFCSHPKSQQQKTVQKNQQQFSMGFGWLLFSFFLDVFLSYVLSRFAICFCWFLLV